MAAAELSRALTGVWTDCTFPVGATAPAEGPAIALIVDPSLAVEAYAVRIEGPGDARVVLTAGSPLGVSHGVHALLEKLGFGFFLTTDTMPESRRGVPSFRDWVLADAPLAKERIVFNWHNFLSGCSSWNYADWETWIDQSRKMRFNTVMIHAYGNNPMFTFAHHGVAKPARFRLSDGKTWLARPDTAEGHAFYRAQTQALFDLYPQIDRLAIWVRTGNTTWTSLKEADLPPEWRAELAARLAADPTLAKRPQAAGRLGLGKVTAAFQRALKEIGRDDVRVWMGSWNFAWMDEADPWTPQGIAFVPLDWDVVHDASHLDTPEKRAEIRAVAAHRPVIPVVWAHHDDGQYIGRSYRPHDDFWTRLADCGADSFGIIHWTTRPLDLYFKSLAGQVWVSTSNRALRATCDDMAGRLFGPAARGPGGEYFSAWIDGAPIFGRDTTDFFRAEGAHQAAVARIRGGDRAGARALMPQVPPAGVIEQYARLSSIGGITRGELGVLVTMNLKWLPYVESVRQALGLRPVRIDFGPTSHEDAAQGAGTLTFHADAESNLWRVLGRRETGAAEFTVSNVAIPGNVPAAWAPPFSRRTRHGDRADDLPARRRVDGAAALSFRGIDAGAGEVPARRSRPAVGSLRGLSPRAALAVRCAASRRLAARGRRRGGGGRGRAVQPAQDAAFRRRRAECGVSDRGPPRTVRGVGAGP